MISTLPKTKEVSKKTIKSSQTEQSYLIYIESDFADKKAIVTKKYDKGFGYGETVYYEQTIEMSNGQKMHKFSNGACSQFLSIEDFCLLTY